MLVLDGLVPPLVIIGAALVLVGLTVACPPQRRVAARLAAVAAIVCCAALLERGMGRTPTYKYGPVRLWSGDVYSDQNSQQCADPYTVTHVVHGAVFYGLSRVVLGPSPLTLAAVGVIAVESAWEVFENTDMVINRYRAATISLDYYGDSILNSVADILACGVGFLLASRLPRRVTITSVVLVEVVLAVWIRDNLTLNVLMLLHPFRAIREWQLGA